MLLVPVLLALLTVPRAASRPPGACGLRGYACKHGPAQAHGCCMQPGAGACWHTSAGLCWSPCSPGWRAPEQLRAASPACAAMRSACTLHAPHTICAWPDRHTMQPHPATAPDPHTSSPPAPCTLAQAFQLHSSKVFVSVTATAACNLSLTQHLTPPPRRPSSLTAARCLTAASASPPP